MTVVGGKCSFCVTLPSWVPAPRSLSRRFICSSCSTRKRQRKLTSSFLLIVSWKYRRNFAHIAKIINIYFWKFHTDLKIIVLFFPINMHNIFALINILFFKCVFLLNIYFWCHFFLVLTTFPLLSTSCWVGKAIEN